MKNKLSVNIFQYMLETEFNPVIHYYYLENDLTIIYLQNHYSNLSKKKKKKEKKKSITLVDNDF